MSANLPAEGDDVIATGSFGRTKGEHHTVRRTDELFVWTRKDRHHSDEPTSREHFWLVFERQV